jgi:hypothetical protein
MKLKNKRKNRKKVLTRERGCGIITKLSCGESGGEAWHLEN